MNKLLLLTVLLALMLLIDRGESRRFHRRRRWRRRRHYVRRRRHCRRRYSEEVQESEIDRWNDVNPDGVEDVEGQVEEFNEE
uniref:Uncharacterized protein n=1 Tax=Ciona savignyi TaxID=51511 RepID=H2YTK1_CIOSA